MGLEQVSSFKFISKSANIAFGHLHRLLRKYGKDSNNTIYTYTHHTTN